MTACCRAAQNRPIFFSCIVGTFRKRHSGLVQARAQMQEMLLRAVHRERSRENPSQDRSYQWSEPECTSPNKSLSHSFLSLRDNWWPNRALACCEMFTPHSVSDDLKVMCRQRQISDCRICSTETSFETSIAYQLQPSGHKRHGSWQDQLKHS